MFSSRFHFPSSIPRRCGLRDRAAFTLVEVVLSIGILAVALVGVFSLADIGLRNYRQALNENIASSIGQQAIAQCLLADFDELEDALPLESIYDERGLPLPFDQAEQKIYESLTERVAGPIHGIAESNATRVRVTITSPTQPDFRKTFISVIARQEGRR